MRKLILLLVLLTIIVMSNLHAQNRYLLKDKYKDIPCGVLQIYKEPSGAIWYDSAVKCSSVIIRTKFGHLRRLPKLHYFYLRYQVMYSGKINPFSYKFYYPNRVTELKVAWWNSSETTMTHDWY